MSFKNAKDGIKKIRTGELLSLLTIVTAFVMTVASGLAESMKQSGKNEYYDTVMLIARIALFGELIISALSSILKILGIVQASKDSKKFSSALVFAGLSLAISVVSTFFTKSKTVSDRISPVTGLLNVFTTYFVVTGIQELAEKIKDSALQKECEKSLFYILRAEIGSIVVQILGILFKNNSAVTAISAVAGIVTLVLSLISYLVYLGLLKKAAKAL